MFAGQRGVRLLEGLEDFGLVLLAHADAGVLDGEGVAVLAGEVGGVRFHA